MSYTAPLRDMRFVLHELFDAAGHCERLGNGLDRELIDGVLEEGARFYLRRVLPRASGHREALLGGADCLMALPEAHFAF
ncbi:hypothetical protein A9G05_05525 [Pseudomonas sp. ENNP23]|nr:hypothetical protein A9G05_05525 [Pseudomonas sp. ENNP23]